jgi:hypothetical protein
MRIKKARKTSPRFSGPHSSVSSGLRSLHSRTSSPTSPTAARARPASAARCAPTAPTPPARPRARRGPARDRPSETGVHARLLDPVRRLVGLLAEELDPLLLQRAAVPGCLDEVQETVDRVVEPLLQGRVGDPAVICFSGCGNTPTIGKVNATRPTPPRPWRPGARTRGAYPRSGRSAQRRLPWNAMNRNTKQ